MIALRKLILVALMISLLPGGFASANCANLAAALENLDGLDLLKPGAAHEADLLIGERPRELNAARREITKKLRESPELAQNLANSLGKSTTTSKRSAGEILFGLDILTQTNPKLFVDAVDGMVNVGKTGTSVEKAFGQQLTNRMIGHLNLTKPEDSIRLFESMSKNAWAREFLATDNNAPRSMLAAMKQISEAAKSDPQMAAKLPAIKTVVNEWIEPRAQKAATGRLAEDSRGSFDHKMDWAMSRVLAVELSKMLRTTDREGARHFAKVARDLENVKDADQLADYERVQELFAEHNLKTPRKLETGIRK